MIQLFKDAADFKERQVLYYATSVAMMEVLKNDLLDKDIEYLRKRIKFHKTENPSYLSCLGYAIYLKLYRTERILP